MKQYKVVKNMLGHLDLINPEDAYDRIMCHEDFPKALEGCMIDENQFVVEEFAYVDDQGYYTGPFAILIKL